ncbi:MAG: phosphoribosylamine--glycine ligase [Phycisphaerae bacterium]|nr:phosphoribosylamine--glycine ligase [Phycisphaerae bacterium]
MRILVVGSGGREHALVWRMAQSKLAKRVYCAPGNAGTAHEARNVAIEAEDTDNLVKFAAENKIDLVVVGPEAPLVGGLVDRLEAAGIRAFGPTAEGAKLEGDKAYAKELMRHYTVPTAEGRVFTNYDDARAYIASRDEPLAVKAAGLASGKGVIVCDEPSDALRAAEKIMVDRIFGAAGDKIVVEEKLTGQEVSVLALIDGRSIYVLEPAQDHKAIGEGDTGPNTGGMGAYCPTPAIGEQAMAQVERQILVPVVDALNRGEIRYRGVLYAGLMMTTTGPKVLEFNVRFGDPETQPILMRLQSDLVEALMATCEGKLDEVTLRWDDRPSVCVVMASGGYPGKYGTGQEIRGLEEADALEDVKVFHAGTAEADGGVVTSGGRVLGVTALGATVADAKARAYQAVDRIHFDGAYCRRDIADKAIRLTTKSK